MQVKSERGRGSEWRTHAKGLSHGTSRRVSSSSARSHARTPSLFPSLRFQSFTSRDRTETRNTNGKYLRYNVITTVTPMRERERASERIGERKYAGSVKNRTRGIRRPRDRVAVARVSRGN